MTYKATQDVVRRVMPLLDRLATRSIDKARLLQYLSARAGADWGVLEVVADTEVDDEAAGATSRVLIFRDRGTGAEHPIRYPVCLPESLEPLVHEEYKRLATDRPLTLMDPALFAHFYQVEFCDRCRWRGADHQQIQRECHFAGHPINFEPDSLADVPGDDPQS
jgi:hypothetical protein